MQIIDNVKQEYNQIKIENNNIILIAENDRRIIEVGKHSPENYYYFTQLQEKHFLKEQNYVFFYVVIGKEHFSIRADLIKYFEIKKLLHAIHLKDIQQSLQQLNDAQIAEIVIKKVKQDDLGLAEVSVAFNYLNEEVKHFYYHELPMIDRLINQILKNYQGTRLVFEYQMTHKFFLLFGVYLFLLGTLQNTRLFYILLVGVNIVLFLIGVFYRLSISEAFKCLSLYFSQTSDERIFKRQWYKKILLANIVCSFLLIVLKYLL